MVTKIARMELEEDRCSEICQALIHNLITPIHWLIIIQHTCIFTPSLCEETINIDETTHSDQIFTPRKSLLHCSRYRGRQIRRDVKNSSCRNTFLLGPCRKHNLCINLQETETWSMKLYSFVFKTLSNVTFLQLALVDLLDVISKRRGV